MNKSLLPFITIFLIIFHLDLRLRVITLLTGVDFYDVDGKLYFGEVTLCHGGGFDKFEPREIDYQLGEKLIIH